MSTPSLGRGLLVLGALAAASCSGSPFRLDPPVPPSTRQAACRPADMSGRLGPFLVDEASEGLRSDLEGVLKSDGIAVVRATCEGIELLPGCEVRGTYAYVPLTPKDKKLVMKDQAQAQANLGFGLGQGLQAAFAAQRQLVLEYRLAGKFKTTVQGVVRGQLKSPACEGATHFVSSADTGTWKSWTTSATAANATVNVAGQGGSASGSSEQSDLNSAGDVATCPAVDAPLDLSASSAPAGCSATVRVALAPIIEADSVAALGAVEQRETECRKGFVMTNDELCVPQEEATIYVCEPSRFEECRAMCVDPPDGQYNSRSCDHLAAMLMGHILEAYEDSEKADAKKQSRLEVLGVVIENNQFVKESIGRFGKRFVQACQRDGKGATCGLAALARIVDFIAAGEAAESGEGGEEAAAMEEEVSRMIAVMAEIFDLVRRGCEDGEQFSCEVVESFLTEPETWEPVLAERKIEDAAALWAALLSRSCDQGNPSSCMTVGARLLEDAPDRVDPATLQIFADRTCTGGLSRGCFLGAATRVGYDPLCHDMLANYRQAIVREHAEATAFPVDADLERKLCGPGQSGESIDYSAMTVDGLGKAFGSLREGCEYGSPVACRVSYWLYSQMGRVVVETRMDKCPGQAEDWDGYMDFDGCPDLDNDGDTIPDAVDRCPDQPETINGRNDEDGCPEVALSGGNIEIGEQIFFAEGKARILDKSAPLLDDIATVLKGVPGLRVEIQGHTDDKGNDKRNKALSQERADEVRKQLIARGIAPDSLTAVGYGEEAPRIPIKGLGPKAVKEARAANRRVEFKIVR